MSTVLVVDDKEMMRDSVATTLQRAGFTVLSADGGEAAITMVGKRRPDAIVTDLRMPGMTGVELLSRVREIDADVPVVLMTAFASVETAVEAMKLGAYDYITKPFEVDELTIAVKRAISHARVLRENAVLKASAARERADQSDPSATGLGRMIGESPAMRRVKQQVLAVAESHGTVLICGESGTGKEVIARAIHELSPRRDSAMLGVNCAALSESLLESELFGHEKGSFTGADQLRKGRFELADGGTLLLDEVSEIGAHVQAKLLRVLQEREFERVGSSLTIGVDVRIVATSNRNLPQSVSSGAFRRDLFFRLNVLPIHLPPLRDRLEDVPALAEHFVSRIALREGLEAVRFTGEAMDLLQRYEWPGNVRELQNICERAVVLGTSGRPRNEQIALERSLVEPWLISAGSGDLEFSADPHIAGHEVPESNGNGFGFAHNEEQQAGIIEVRGRTLADIERDAIISTLEQYGGHRQKTARSLGIGVRTLGLKLKKWKEDNLVEQTL